MQLVGEFGLKETICYLIVNLYLQWKLCNILSPSFLITDQTTLSFIQLLQAPVIVDGNPQWLKLNTDVERLDAAQWRLGAVIWNDIGDLIVTAGQRILGNFPTEIAQGMAIRWVMRMAARHGFLSLLVECDYKLVTVTQIACAGCIRWQRANRALHESRSFEICPSNCSLQLLSQS